MPAKKRGGELDCCAGYSGYCQTDWGKKNKLINFKIVIYILLLPLEIKYEGEDHIEKNDIRGISQDRFMKVAIDRKPK